MAGIQIRLPAAVRFVAITVDRQNGSIDEVMEVAHRELRQNLAQELLERIKTASPAFFERLVILQGRGSRLRGKFRRFCCFGIPD